MQGSHASAIPIGGHGCGTLIRVHDAQVITGAESCVHRRTLTLLFKPSTASLGALGISCLPYSPCIRHSQPGVGPTSNAMVPDGVWFCLSRHCLGSLSPGLCQPLMSSRGWMKTEYWACFLGLHDRGATKPKTHCQVGHQVPMRMPLSRESMVGA